MDAAQITPVGWPGPAQHTATAACDGYHPPGGPCTAAPVQVSLTPPGGPDER